MIVLSSPLLPPYLLLRTLFRAALRFRLLYFHLLIAVSSFLFLFLAFAHFDISYHPVPPRTFSCSEFTGPNWQRH